MQVQGLTANAAKALNQSKAQGVLVRDVGLGSPADRAGIRRGDLRWSDIVGQCGSEVKVYSCF